MRGFEPPTSSTPCCTYTVSYVVKSVYKRTICLYAVLLTVYSTVYKALFATQSYLFHKYNVLNEQLIIKPNSGLRQSSKKGNGINERLSVRLCLCRSLSCASAAEALTLL